MFICTLKDGLAFGTFIWVYYYRERPDEFGPEWQLRLMMMPVLPSPEWSRKPLFDF